MRRSLAPISLMMTLALGGCGVFFWNKKPMPPPMEYSIQSPYPDVRTIAIAPAINLSGSRDFDTLAVSDTLYAEMQQVEGLNVLPLNKTLLAMQRMHIRSIDDVKTAQKLAEAMHVDGLVVPAVTAYDPYNPPVVGMILQMYTPEEAAPATMPAKADAPPVPVALPLPRAAVPGKPTSMGENAVSNPAGSMVVMDVSSGTLGGPGEASKGGTTDLSGPPDTRMPVVKHVDGPISQPVAQVSAVFNSTNQTVLKELQVFAEGRTEYDSALSDQKYLMDSDSYMRFVAHAMIQRLMDVERTRVSDR